MSLAQSLCSSRGQLGCTEYMRRCCRIPEIIANTSKSDTLSSVAKISHGIVVRCHVVRQDHHVFSASGFKSHERQSLVTGGCQQCLERPASHSRWAIITAGSHSLCPWQPKVAFPSNIVHTREGRESRRQCRERRRRLEANSSSMKLVLLLADSQAATQTRIFKSYSTAASGATVRNKVSLQQPLSAMYGVPRAPLQCS